MKDFFRDIFQYHNHTNQELSKLLLENQDLVSEKIIALFSHTVNAHHIWNARISGGSMPGVHDIHPLDQCQEMDIANYKTTLDIISNFNLDQVTEYQNSKGDRYNNTVKEILFHISNHTSHHRGQVMASLRPLGIEPFISDYIFYKR